MERESRNLGYYGSVMWLVVTLYSLGRRLLAIFGIWPFEDMAKYSVGGWAYVLLLVVLIMVIPVFLHSAPRKSRKAWGSLFSSMFISVLAGWAFRQDLEWRTAVNVIAIILAVYAFMRFRDIRSKEIVE